MLSAGHRTRESESIERCPYCVGQMRVWTNHATSKLGHNPAPVGFLFRDGLVTVRLHLVPKYGTVANPISKAVLASIQNTSRYRNTILDSLAG